MGESGRFVTKPVYCDAVRRLAWVCDALRVPGLSVFSHFFEEACVKVLKLSAQGLPQSWISLEQAVIHYAADEVRWEVGAQVAVFRGGHNAVTGEQICIQYSNAT